MLAIETTDLTKRYGTHPAVSGLSLAIEPGEIYGFLGPNGAGKSTTIGMVLGNIRPTDGSVRLLGVHPRETPRILRRRVGAIPERCGLPGRLTGREQLQFSIDIHATDEDPDRLLRRVGLDGDGSRRVDTYSTGMGQRLRLALALIGDPSVLLLDEPTRGLDPTGQQRLRRVLRNERDAGTTVFFSSHQLQQIRSVCDRVGILMDGRLWLEIKPIAFTNDLSHRCLLTLSAWDPDWHSQLEGRATVGYVEYGGEALGHHRLLLGFTDPDAREDVIAVLPETTIVDVSNHLDGFEDLFAHLSGGITCK